jgi:signal transduction histidine kinase
MRAQEILSIVGQQVLLSSVYLRDALLDPDMQAISRHRLRLENTYERLDKQLDSYVPVLDSSEERAQIDRLRDEIRSFRVTAGQVLGSPAYRSPAGARMALNTEVVPKREGVIRVSEEIRALNRAAVLQQQQIISEIHQTAEHRSWQWLGAALAISFGIGILATTYSSQLEATLRRQRAVEAQNTRYLQLLSAKLITAQEEERQTIARELHDEVGQILTAIKVELAVAERRLNASGGAGELLDDAVSIADTGLQTVRNLSQLLRPPLLDDLGLPAAVDWHLQAFSKRFAIKTELLQDGLTTRLSPDVELAAYRIVQEATTNVARHARATRCRVGLRREGSHLVLEIEDDGRGFDVSALEGPAGRHGLGLLGIRERTNQLKGSQHIDSGPGRGTRVRVNLPVDSVKSARSDRSPAGELLVARRVHG